MRKSPEETSKNVKRFTEAIYVGKRKEMRSFCLENGNLSRQMNEKTVHNDIIICWERYAQVFPFTAQQKSVYCSERRFRMDIRKNLLTGW